MAELTYNLETLCKSKEFARYQDILRAVFRGVKEVTKQEARNAIDNHFRKVVK